MVRKHQHCRAITRVPEIAQTSYSVKLGAIIDMMDTVLLAQRQAAWKVFFPPGYEPTTTTTDTTGTTGTEEY